MPKKKKIFVLDTSVIIYDHEAIQHFAEHDIAIPITVLEELDQFKKGNDSKNYCAREFIRFIDRISQEHLLQDWVSLNGPDKGRFKVILNTQSALDAEKVFGDHKSDHKILNAAFTLQETEKNKDVILVSKDIALRLKAKALNLPAQDYEVGKIPDIEKLYKGKCFLEDVPGEIIDRIYSKGSIPAAEVPVEKHIENQYFIIRNAAKSVLGYYNSTDDVVERVEKKGVYGIMPRNAEQVFAVHALLNPKVRLVTVQGVAGTGKTLLALACALEQRRSYRQIYVARPIVPLSNKDIGFLPGDIKSKLGPYMQPLWDNLKFIKNQFKDNDKNFQRIDEMVKSEKIEISPLAYIRGRTLSNIIFIVDEGQNLTPHEVKTIITRAGENTKIIFTGDVRQIDTPYLDAQSNGLSYLIEKLKGNQIFAHITLEKGERSELANLANEML
ncbi:PhoH family protein [Oligoflexia bacterium]|nr:PhoH family protein [Oligoflexia bacterium]